LNGLSAKLAQRHLHLSRVCWHACDSNDSRTRGHFNLGSQPTKRRAGFAGFAGLGHKHFHAVTAEEQFEVHAKGCQSSHEFDLLVERGHLGLGVPLGIEKIQPFLEFFGERAFDELLDLRHRHGAVNVHRLEGRNGCTYLCQECADVVGFVGGHGLADVNAFLEIGVGLNVNATFVGAGTKHLLHVRHGRRHGQAGHGDGLKHGTHLKQKGRR